ncbi:hypothetical protein Tco_1009589, partial [Tanacetum coccineum]
MLKVYDRTLQAREQVIAMLKFHLKGAQDRMKTYADKKRSDREFAVGDLVYLKLQPYRQLTLRVHRQHKLSAKFFGPFKVLQKVGRVAYKLELPSTAQIHPVFHVLDRKLAKQGNRVVVYGLIQWSNGTVEDFTWELLTDIEKSWIEALKDCEEVEESSASVAPGGWVKEEVKSKFNHVECDALCRVCKILVVDVYSDKNKHLLEPDSLPWNGRIQFHRVNIKNDSRLEGLIKCSDLMDGGDESPGIQENFGIQMNLIGTDIAKITRERSKPDKHEHGKGKRIQEPGECYQ